MSKNRNVCPATAGNGSPSHGQFDEIVTWGSILVLVAIVMVIQLSGNLLARKVLRR